MGFRMKKMLNYYCDEIDYNNETIAVGANKITLLNRFDGTVIHSFKGIKDIASLKLDEDYVYVKSTSGLYYMFSLENYQIINKGQCKEKMPSSHDGKFFVYEKGKVLDILDFKDKCYYLIKYNFFTTKYQKLCVSESDFYCRNWRVNYNQSKAYLLFTKKQIVKNPKIECYLSIIDFDTMLVEKNICFSMSCDKRIMGLLSDTSILLNDFSIYHIDTQEYDRLNFDINFVDKTYGYFVTINYCSKTNKLLVVYSKKVLLFDLKSKEFISDYSAEYIDNAEYIDGKVYIATWNGLFVDDIENNTSDGSVC